MPPKIKTKKGRRKKVDKPKECDSKGTKSKRKMSESYKVYIQRKKIQCYPCYNMKISKKAMAIMDQFLSDMFEKIASEASRLLHVNKKSTLTEREIHTAIRLLLPEDLFRYAESEAKKALGRFKFSRERSKERQAIV